MKLLLLLLLLFSLSATAKNEVDKDKYCGSIFKIARGVMDLRQSGEPMPNVLTLATNESVKSIVISAYQVPRYNSKKLLRQSINEFANHSMIKCYEGKL